MDVVEGWVDRLLLRLRVVAILRLVRVRPGLPPVLLHGDGWHAPRERSGEALQEVVMHIFDGRGVRALRVRPPLLVGPLVHVAHVLQAAGLLVVPIARCISVHPQPLHLSHHHLSHVLLLHLSPHHIGHLLLGRSQHRTDREVGGEVGHLKVVEGRALHATVAGVVIELHRHQTVAMRQVGRPIPPIPRDEAVQAVAQGVAHVRDALGRPLVARAALAVGVGLSPAAVRKLRLGVVPVVRACLAVPAVGSLDHRDDAAALEPLGLGQARELHERGVDVDELHEGARVGDAVGVGLLPKELQLLVLRRGEPRRANDERHARRELRVGVLGPKPALAQVPAVVAEEGHGRVLRHLQVIQLVEDLANVEVGSGDGSVVGAPALFRRLELTRRGHAEIAADAVPAAREGARRCALGIVAVLRLVVNVLVHVDEALRDVPRRVRAPEAGGDEEGLLLAVQPILVRMAQRGDGPVGQLAVVKLLVRLVLRAAGAPALVRALAVDVGVAPRAVGAAVVVVVEVLELASLHGALRPRRLVIAERVVGVVDFASTQAEVSVVLEVLRDWGDWVLRRRRRPEVRVHVPNLQSVRVSAAHERVAGRCTVRRLGVRTRKHHGARRLGELIEAGRDHVRVPIGLVELRAHVVDDDQEDVLCAFGSLLRSGW
eukprot:scaffold24718_cov56-Phaeocystis_antarctica.AAC.4